MHRDSNHISNRFSILGAGNRRTRGYGRQMSRSRREGRHKCISECGIIRFGHEHGIMLATPITWEGTTPSNMATSSVTSIAASVATTPQGKKMCIIIPQHYQIAMLR